MLNRKWSAEDKLQLSYGCRAMPQGTPSIVEASLAQHKIDLLTSRDVEDADIIEKCKKFSKRWSFVNTKSDDLK